MVYVLSFLESNRISWITNRGLAPLLVPYTFIPTSTLSFRGQGKHNLNWTDIYHVLILVHFPGDLSPTAGLEASRRKTLRAVGGSNTRVPVLEWRTQGPGEA